MNPSLQQLANRVERYLDHIVSHYDKGDGYYRFRYESTALIVVPLQWGEQHTMVRIAAGVLLEIDPSPLLWETIARTNKDYLIGKLCYWPEDRSLLYEYFMLGDYLDEEELLTALTMVAYTADHLDDELQKILGGRRIFDD